MNDELKKYLKENLKLDFEVTPDLYGVNPDQIKLMLKLEGEVIDTITLYDFKDN